MKVFISSVVNGFETYRNAARRAVVTVDADPVMCEDFGARPYSSERACLTEIESSDVYVLVLGPRYGFEQAEGESVTQQEFRHAVSLRKPILVFIQDVDMEPRQAAFREEVSAYHSGFCREHFSDPEALKEKLIQNLLRLGRSQVACSQSEFAERVSKAIPNQGYFGRQYEARFVFAFLAQPSRQIALHDLDARRDEIFARLCALGLAEMRRGYEPIDESDCTGLLSGKTTLRQYDDGLVVLEAPATREVAGVTCSQWYVPPSHLKALASAAYGLVSANSGWCRLGLTGMEQAVMAELPERATNSFSLAHRGEDSGFEDKLLVPCTEAAYGAWVGEAIAKLQRRFGPR